MESPLLGALFCCVGPLVYGAGMFALGFWIKKHNGLPWKVVRKEAEDLED
jgi:hypothetical protein